MQRSLTSSTAAAVIAGVIAGVIVGLGGAAHAKVIREDPLEDTSTELGIIARVFSFMLAGKVLEPPLSPEDANPTGAGLFDLRFYASTKTPRWKVTVHDQLSGVSRSHALAGFALGRGLPPPRWLPLTATITDDPTVTLRNTVDWASVAYNRGRVTITAGRQPIVFGRAKLWSPMDLIAPFSLTEVDTEYRSGADALRIDVSSGDRLAVTLVGVAGELEDDHDLHASIDGSAVVARATYRLDHGELGALAGGVRGDLVGGVDFAWDTGAFDLYGESTVTRVTSRSLAAPLSGIDTLVKAATGATFHPTEKLTIGPELSFDSAGAAHARDYLSSALSPRVAIGEQVTLGRFYGSAIADWQPHPLLHVVVATIANLRDPSALASVTLAYSVAANATAQLGGYIPLGRRPGSDLTPRSEFGLYPTFGFLELKAVL